MKRALIITGDELLPLTSGRRVRTWNFVKALSKDYIVDVLCLRRSEQPDEGYKKHIRRIWYVDNVKYDPFSNSKIWGRLFNMLRSIPWEIAYYYQPAFEEKLKHVLEQDDYDYVFVRYIWEAQYLFRLRDKIKGKVIVDLDDIAVKKKDRNIKITHHATRYERIRREINNFIYARYHKINLKRADHCLICSKEDKDFITKQKWSNSVKVIPNTIEVAQQCKDSTPPVKNKIILFIGILSYYPNVDAVSWFVSNIFPLIRKADPNVRLHIVGRSPTKKVLALGDVENVHVYADVPDIAPYYQEASLTIAPIRVAGGTRIKILESALYRRPVVATTIGAEGLNMVDGKHCIIADDPENFSRGCLKLLEDGQFANRLTDNNFHFVNENYNSEAVGEKIRQVFQ